MIPYRIDGPAIIHFSGGRTSGYMVSVCKHDADAYCRILRVLGMEDEGDAVAEVERLKAQSSGGHDHD